MKQPPSTGLWPVLHWRRVPILLSCSRLPAPSMAPHGKKDNKMFEDTLANYTTQCDQWKVYSYCPSATAATIAQHATNRPINRHQTMVHRGLYYVYNVMHVVLRVISIYTDIDGDEQEYNGIRSVDVLIVFCVPYIPYLNQICGLIYSFARMCFTERLFAYFLVD
eukprot:359987_1